MKHLNIQEMAKRLKNATPEQKEKLYPVFKKKVQNAKKEGTITKDDQQKYYEILEDMR
jgi:ABC-type transporter MlaC component